MSKYDDEIKVQKLRQPRISRDQLGGWDNLKQAYRELDPDVTYEAFRHRVLTGRSVVEAGTMPRSNRGRPRKIV